MSALEAADGCILIKRSECSCFFVLLTAHLPPFFQYYAACIFFGAVSGDKISTEFYAFITMLLSYEKTGGQAE